jgi:hypothetical protein
MSEEVKALLRAYTALALAQRAAELYNDDAPGHPYLAAIVNSQEVAARELGAVLERVLPVVVGAAAPLEAEDECAALIM